MMTTLNASMADAYPKNFDVTASRIAGTAMMKTIAVSREIICGILEIFSQQQNEFVLDFR